MANRSDDNLCFQGNPQIKKLLEKYQSGNKEKIIFSDFIIKINRRDKAQTRIILLTDTHLYNIMPNDYSKCKRRIDLGGIMAISKGLKTDEFVIHIPTEYDYRYKSDKTDKITEILGKLVVSRSKAVGGNIKKVNIKVYDQSDLKNKTVTKFMARFQERECRLIAKRDGWANNSSDDDDRKTIGNRNSKVITKVTKYQKGKVSLQDFELLKVIGRGAFGKVMQVRKKDDGKIYALKILKKKQIIARNQTEHIKAERKILQTLDHPFLMTLQYAFQSKEKLYLVLEYFCGGELFFHLKNNRRFSETIAKFWVGEITLAFDHLHGLDVLYRDLKPENILLDPTGHVVLTDFGLSKNMIDQKKTKTFCGTAEYLAPEIITGRGHDKAVDWWSLGILMYELTVGIPPFYCQNSIEMYKKIQHGVLRFPTFLTNRCKKLIIDLLNRDPKRRLGSIADADDIKSHSFYADIDWERMLARGYISEYIPKVKDELDTSNFESTFTKEIVVDSVVEEKFLEQTLTDYPDEFSGFTYVDKKNVL